MQEYLPPFRKKLVKEGFLRAAAWALAAGFAASFLYLLIRHLFFHTADVKLCAAMGFAIFVLTGLVLYWSVYRPTWMYTARRVDALGLEARAETMLLMADKQSAMANLQRQDAIQWLKVLSPEQLKIQLPKKESVLAGILAGMTILTFFCPYLDISTRLNASNETNEADVEKSAESERIAQMLESLRQQVNASNLSEEEKQRLLNQLAQMEASFDLSTAGLEELAQMTQLYQNMALDLSSLEIYGSLTAELMNCPRLRELGEAILAQNQTQVRRFFMQLEEELTEDIAHDHQMSKLKTLIEDLQSVTELAKATESEQSLAYILTTFKTNLSQILSSSLSGKDVSESLHKELYRTAEYICISFYGDTQMMEQVFEENTQSGEQNGDSSSGGENGMDDAAGMSQTLYSQGTSGVGFGGGEDRKEKTAATEHMYEPTLDTSADENYVPGRDESPAVQAEKNTGNVAYETVYGLYYARMLDEMEHEALPEDILDAVETYFNNL